jgi:hypothetical protein
MPQEGQLGERAKGVYRRMAVTASGRFAMLNARSLILLVGLECYRNS